MDIYMDGWVIMVAGHFLVLFYFGWDGGFGFSWQQGPAGSIGQMCTSKPNHTLYSIVQYRYNSISITVTVWIEDRGIED